MMNVVCASNAQGLDYRRYGLFLYRVVAAEDVGVRRARSQQRAVLSSPSDGVNNCCRSSKKSGYAALRHIKDVWSRERDVVQYGLGLVLIGQAVDERLHYERSATGRRILGRSATHASSSRENTSNADDIHWNPQRSALSSPHHHSHRAYSTAGVRPLVRRAMTPSSSSHSHKERHQQNITSLSVDDKSSELQSVPLRATESFHMPANGLAIASASLSRARGRRLSTAEQARLDSDHLQLVLAAVPNGMNSATYNLSLKADRILNHLERRVR